MRIHIQSIFASVAFVPVKHGTALLAGSYESRRVIHRFRRSGEGGSLARSGCGLGHG
jgi:hypothetical protein